MSENELQGVRDVGLDMSNLTHSYTFEKIYARENTVSSDSDLNASSFSFFVLSFNWVELVEKKIFIIHKNVCRFPFTMKNT